MEITGAVKAILPVQSGISSRTGNPWQSMEFVLETQEQYPKSVCMRLFGADKINSYNIQMGEVITACFDLDAHEYNGRWYNQVNCFSIKRNGEVVPVQQAQQPQQPQQPQAEGTQYPPTANAGQPVQQTIFHQKEPQEDDLPF